MAQMGKVLDIGSNMAQDTGLSEESIKKHLTWYVCVS